MSAVEEAYALLRRRGEISADALPASTAALRRRAATDGLRIVQSTTTDYVGRKTRLVAVVDSTGTIAYAP